MKKFRIIAITIIAMLASGAAWAQDENETPADDETTEVIDSKQYNKWTNSLNFKLGLLTMNKGINSSDEESDELEPYEKAASLFKKELKQHPKNGYAKCNLAICESHVANITVNKFLIDVFNGEAELPIPNNVSEEERMELLQAYYQQLMDNKSQAIKQTLKTLDEGIAMLPNADKESRCKALLSKSEILKDNDADEAVLETCLIEATKVHPCDKSYNELLSYYSSHENTEMLEKCALEAAKFIPDNPMVQYTLAGCEIKRGNYDKALEIIDRLIANNPDNYELLKMRASTLTRAKKYKEAADNVVTLANAGALDDVYSPLAAIATASDDNLNMVLDIVKDQVQLQNTEELPMNWSIIEAMMLNNISHDYNNALKSAERAVKVNDDVSVLMYIANLYYKLGDMPKALCLLDETAIKDDENDDALKRKIEIEMNCGMADNVITDSKVLSCLGNNDMMPYCYNGLGWAHCAKGEWSKAIDDYKAWIAFDNENDIDNITPTYNLARTHLLAGDEEGARDELQAILNSHDFTSNDELKMNILYYLGRTTESKAILDQLAADTERVRAMTSEEIEAAEQLPEVMSLYNLACAYSLHGDSDRAFQYLKQHFDSNSDDAINYDYSILDYDFDKVRQLPEFLNIINEYKTRWLNGEYKPAK